MFLIVHPTGNVYLSPLTLNRAGRSALYERCLNSRRPFNHVYNVNI